MEEQINPYFNLPAFLKIIKRFRDAQGADDYRDTVKEAKKFKKGFEIDEFLKYKYQLWKGVAEMRIGIGNNTKLLSVNMLRNDSLEFESNDVDLFFEVYLHNQVSLFLQGNFMKDLVIERNKVGENTNFNEFLARVNHLTTLVREVKAKKKEYHVLAEFIINTINAMEKVGLFGFSSTLVQSMFDIMQAAINVTHLSFDKLTTPWDIDKMKYTTLEYIEEWYNMAAEKLPRGRRVDPDNIALINRLKTLKEEQVAALNMAPSTDELKIMVDKMDREFHRFILTIPHEGRQLFPGPDPTTEVGNTACSTLLWSDGVMWDNGVHWELQEQITLVHGFLKALINDKDIVAAANNTLGPAMLLAQSIQPAETHLYVLLSIHESDGLLNTLKENDAAFIVSCNLLHADFKEAWSAMTRNHIKSELVCRVMIILQDFFNTHVYKFAALFEEVPSTETETLKDYVRETALEIPKDDEKDRDKLSEWKSSIDALVIARETLLQVCELQQTGVDSIVDARINFLRSCQEFIPEISELREAGTSLEQLAENLKNKVAELQETVNTNEIAYYAANSYKQAEFLLVVGADFSLTDFSLTDLLEEYEEEILQEYKSEQYCSGYSPPSKFITDYSSGENRAARSIYNIFEQTLPPIDQRNSFKNELENMKTAMRNIIEKTQALYTISNMQKDLETISIYNNKML